MNGATGAGLTPTDKEWLQGLEVISGNRSRKNIPLGRATGVIDTYLDTLTSISGTPPGQMAGKRRRAIRSGTGLASPPIRSGRTNKMARLPYLEADQVAPEYRDMLKRNTNLHKLLVNSPDMARAFNGIGGYIRF